MNETKESIIETINQINDPIEKKLIKMRFGFFNNTIMQVEDISKELNIPTQEIKKIIKKALNKISIFKNLTLKYIINYINDIRIKNGEEPFISYNAKKIIDLIDQHHKIPSLDVETDVEDLKTVGSYYRIRREYAKTLTIENSQLLYTQKQIIIDYQKIKKTLDKYSKKKQLIDTIHQLHRLPKSRANNNGEFEATFEDGTDQASYYFNLKVEINKIKKKLDEKKQLCLRELEFLQDYNDILNALDLYSRKAQLIQSIHELHRVPISKTKTNPRPERTFENGQDQANYYNKIKKDCQKISKALDQGIPITEEEEKLLNDYKEIESVIELYSRKTQLITSIHDLHRIPKTSQENHGTPEKVFEDGYDQGKYFYSLRSKVCAIQKKIENNLPITEGEKQKVKDYNEIINVLNEYSKTNQLLQSIYELHRAPKLNTDKNNPEKVFANGSNQARYYYYLSRSAQKIMKKKENKEYVTEHENNLLQDYMKIINVLSFFKVCRIDQIEYIKKICEIFNIDISKNQQLLRKSIYEVYIKISFLKNNSLPITYQNGKVNEIMYMSEQDLQNKYEITIDELTKQYIDGQNDINDKIKLLKM